MSRVTRTYGSAVAKVEAPTSTNRDQAQYPAYEFDTKHELVSTLMVGVMGNNTYYETKEVLQKEFEAIHAKALKEDPEFYAKALIYARSNGYMRTQPIYGLVQLSRMLDDKQPKKGSRGMLPLENTLFKSTFDKIIFTPNDLNDFITIRGKMGKSVKSAINNWLLNKMSQYWAIKYGSSSKQGFSLKDIIKLTRPIGDTKEGMNDLFKYLIDKEYNEELLDQIHWFNVLKRATTVAEKIEAIEKGKLPHEVVTPFANDKAVWDALVPQMPIMAMMKNLATIERHDAATANKAYIKSVFSDPQRIAKSKILPYRFMEAEKHVSAQWIKDALRDALELSFANIPDIEGNTAVFLDKSGSMGQGYGHPEVLPKAAIFAVALMKKIDDGKLVLFNSTTQLMNISKRDSLLTQAQRITPSGGTNISLPFEEITSSREKFDNIILITDEQQNQGSSVYRTFAQYQEKVNRNTKLFVIDVNAYRNAAFSVNHPNVYYIFGWSDKALDFISYMSKDAKGMVKMIEQS